MADDLNADWKNDRLAYMPNLKAHFADGGTKFENHVAVIPVCGPSRSSILLGRYPHNTGYMMNTDPGSHAAFTKQGNNTVGKWLKDARYYTAFFGKFFNGCEGHVPSGWSYWGGLVNTYDFYNATIWEKDWENPKFGPRKQRVMTDVHQADFLGKFTVDNAAKAVAANRPFFTSVTLVMYHWNTCYGPDPASDYPAYDPHWEFNLAQKNFTCGETCKMPISPRPTHRNRHTFYGQTNPNIEVV
jgi:arylsulfatase A-like enzyme